MVTAKTVYTTSINESLISDYETLKIKTTEASDNDMMIRKGVNARRVNCNHISLLKVLRTLSRANVFRLVAR